MNLPERIQGSRAGGLVPVLLLAAIGVTLYWRTLPAPFIFDDAVAIVDNPSLRRLGPAMFAAPPDTPTAGRPVVNATLAINYALGGLDVTGYHAVNIAIHVLCAILLYGIVLGSGGTVERGRPGLALPCLRASSHVRRHGRTRCASSTVPPDTSLALSASLLWLAHPLTGQCVAYVTQRTESIMALFALLTLYASIRGWNLVAVASCALGMASKETMVTVPLLVVLYDWAYRDGPWRAVLARRRGLYAGLAATWLVPAALLATAPRAGTVGFGHGVTAWQYALNQSVSVVGYLRHAVWPEGLLLDYGFPRMMTAGAAAPYAAILVALLAAAGVLLVKRPRLGYPAAWFFIVLAPTSSIVPVATEVAADRRAYLALAGLAVLAALAGRALVRAATRRFGPRPGPHAVPWVRPAGAALLVPVVAALSAVSWHRAGMYRRPVTLWTQSVEAVPRNHRARTNLAVALAAEGRYGEATAQMLRAVAADPDSTIAADNLAALLAAGEGPDR